MTRWVKSEVKAKNMGFMIGSPLLQGALARRWNDVFDYARNWLNSPIAVG